MIFSTRFSSPDVSADGQIRQLEARERKTESNRGFRTSPQTVAIPVDQRVHLQSFDGESRANDRTARLFQLPLRSHFYYTIPTARTRNCNFPFAMRKAGSLPDKFALSQMRPFSRRVSFTYSVPTLTWEIRATQVCHAYTAESGWHEPN